MQHFTSYNGAEISYRVIGEGPALVCLAGGPGRDAAYLGDLGGLDRNRRLVIPDSRGTGDTVSGIRAGKAVAGSFPQGRHRPLREVGHYPWVDEPDLFRSVVEEFLSDAADEADEAPEEAPRGGPADDSPAESGA